MQKWEYLVASIEFGAKVEGDVRFLYINGVRKNTVSTAELNLGKKVPRIHEILNELGEQGWELIVHRQGVHNFFFKRPVVEEKEGE